MSIVLRRWLLPVLLAVGRAGAASPSVDVPLLPAGPKLVGDLSDPLWQQAVRVGGFVDIDTGAPERVPTEACLLATTESLYVGFVCHEPAMDKLVTETSGHEGPVRNDDCAVIILDPPNGRTWCIEVAINSAGVHADVKHTPLGRDTGYSSGVESKARRLADRWTCEAVIPYDDLGSEPQPGEVWGLNLGRTRRTVKPAEDTAWSQAPRGLAVAATCGRARFAGQPGGAPVEVLSRGALTADEPEDNLFVVRVGPGQPGQVTAEVRLDGRLAASDDSALAAGENKTLSVAYTLPEAGRPMVGFTVKVNGATVYQSALQAIGAKRRGPRTWQVPDPLFHELLSDRPPGWRREGALFWGVLNDVALLRSTAVRLAVAYSEEAAYREHAEHKLILVGHGVIRDLNQAHPIARQRIRNAPTVGRPPAQVPWLLDPAAIAAQLAGIEDVFAGPHPLVFGIYSGDEIEDQVIKQGVALMARPKDYQYVKTADEEVRRDFGGGQWGIPAGLAERDPNPYKWIAFRRWVNQKMRDRNRRLRDIVRSHDSELPVVSTDSAHLPPLEWSSQAELSDIFTIQTACRRDPWRAQPGCITKLLVDLTGKEVWPCVHIENYGMNTTPEEAIEELSQVFRNGGTGLHLYMPDTANATELVGDTRVTYFGSPRRWHTVTNVLDLLRTMPAPRVPDETGVAVLFNDDTLMATPYDAERPYTDQTETCYTFLGPVARSWFRFVDCGQLLRWPALIEHFKVLFVPCARYQRPEIVERLTAFVRAGGTLICADAAAFETDLIGTDTSAARRALFGVEVGEPLPAITLRTDWVAPGSVLPLRGDSYALTPDDGVDVLARYDDGSPAVTRRKLGTGSAILLGNNPFELAAVADAAWRDFFTAWAKALGMPTGLNIWRFRFPDEVIWREPAPRGLCLTNNHVLWREEKPSYPLNLDTGGGYRCAPAPDAAPDAPATDGLIPFATGHLTDRRVSIFARKVARFRAANYALPASRWLVEWTVTDPVTVTFDLKQPRPLREFHLWFRETLPAVAVEASADGAAWSAVGAAEPKQAGEDVLDVAIPLNAGTPCRYLRATFAARQPGQKMSLIEAEVWAAP